MTEVMKNWLRDALYNTAEKSGASVDYAKGVVVGVVSTLRSIGNDFDMAYNIMYECLPRLARLECIPEVWEAHDQLKKEEKGGE